MQNSNDRPITVNARELGKIMLDDFCERCFWFTSRFPLSSNHPFRSPMPGIASTLDAYIKRVVDTAFEKHGTLPNWLSRALGQSNINLNIQKNLKSKKWQVALNDIQLTGQPDAIWELDDGSVLIADYKVAQQTESQERIFPLYKAQLNAYAYLAKHNGLTVHELVLVYLEPLAYKEEPEKALEISSEEFTLKFKCSVKSIPKLSDQEVEEMIRRTGEILRLPSPPERKENCKGCQALGEWLAKVVPFAIC